MSAQRQPRQGGPRQLKPGAQRQPKPGARRRPKPAARTVVVLAAGEGKRMRSALPKVLHPLLGRTLIEHVLAATGPLGAQRTAVVVGHGADQVSQLLDTVAPAALAVAQGQQLGTGHATRVALGALDNPTGTVVVC